MSEVEHCTHTKTTIDDVSEEIKSYLQIVTLHITESMVFDKRKENLIYSCMHHMCTVVKSSALIYPCGTL